MTSKMGNRKAIVLVAAALLTAGPGVAAAIDFGKMMNPSRWMGGGDRSDDYYGDGGPGYGYGPPGYGYGAPGYGYPPGYGVPPYGAPGYGSPPAYGLPGAAPAYSPPPQGGAPSDTSAEEIEALKQRIKALEAEKAQSSAPPAYGGGQSAYPPVSPDYGQQGGYVPPPSYSGQSPYQSSPPSYGSQPAYNPSRRSGPGR